MDEKKRFNLLIDNERYPVSILPSEEEGYREAAKQINYKLNKYRSAFPEFSSIQHWKMVALDLAYENFSMKERNDTLPYQEKLKELNEDIERYIQDSRNKGL
ncbi:cell division protein ZapA [Phocaeicola sp.]|jgi:cell division protein ZapA|uniref:cell division protein ZapA n=1 Tax=Phocaeicola sp. TaxID=2773926 RepID=UPI00033A2322|nr:cell division protein ZapA [Phocaeicola sp.]MDR3794184.1 cell division protein ZapA [Phocaeicola sp.]CDD48898.1 putative uncharacterized protein [Bacteroides sp. CAG:875]